MSEPVLQLRADVAEWGAEDGEAVLLDLSRSTYAGVNRAGTLLLTALTRGATRSELVALLTAEFRIAEATAEQDVTAFVAACRERQLLQS